MRMFDVHELEDRITEVLQLVQETGETVAVTKGGEVIAHLVPASTPSLMAKPPDDDPMIPGLIVSKAKGMLGGLKTPALLKTCRGPGPTLIVLSPSLGFNGLRA